MSDKKDYLEKCNQTAMPIKQHVEKKCSKCRKADCLRAVKSQ